MEREKLVVIKEYLKKGNKVLPEYVEQNPYHWYSRLYMAQVMQEQGNIKDAYTFLRSIYEDNTFRFDKGIHGAYEEYIIEKVRFFEQIARLSLQVTKEPAQSIPYLDEALIMLDGAESVYPYVNPRDISLLKKSYLKMLN